LTVAHQVHDRGSQAVVLLGGSRRVLAGRGLSRTSHVLGHAGNSSGGAGLGVGQDDGAARPVGPCDFGAIVPGGPHTTNSYGGRRVPAGITGRSWPVPP